MTIGVMILAVWCVLVALCLLWQFATNALGVNDETAAADLLAAIATTADDRTATEPYTAGSRSRVTVPLAG